MKNPNFASVSETQQDEEDLSRMNDEGCPNDPVLRVRNSAGMLDDPESLGLEQEFHGRCRILRALYASAEA